MINMRTITVVGTLALFGATGCADLAVENPNAPDAERALATAGDVESLIAGSYRQWWLSSGDYSGASFFLSTASFQHSAWPANAGAVFYSSFPRGQIVNDIADQYYGNMSYTWRQANRALAAVSDGLRAIENNPDIASELGPNSVRRIKTFGKFVQGLAHGSLALFYDQGFIIDEEVPTRDDGGAPAELEPVPYGQMMEAALGYFDEAIALAEQGDFTIPSEWMSVDVESGQLARIAHSMKARYRAAVSRTPEERANVDWQAVLDDIGNGVTETWSMEIIPFDFWRSDVASYFAFPGWQQSTYFILGMADQSGDYQKWLDVPVGDRLPNIDDEPVLIVTPDERFAQGGTVEEQEENPGRLYSIPPFSLQNSWQKPDRGTWRWSYYWTSEQSDNHVSIGGGPWPEITVAEMDLLAAEAHYRLGRPGQAATLVNKYRTAAGLSATDASGTNVECVPRLPDTTCGGLFEMIKWEKRLETQFKGLHGVPWYFEGRGWGDLYEGTPLQFPMPALELNLHDMPSYTFGGAGGDFAASASVYGWPGEQ